MGIREPHKQRKYTPTTKPNLHNQIWRRHGTPIKYLPPNKSYNMLGVHINPLLDFRGHLKHITINIRKLVKALAKRLLSLNRNKIVIKQLLKSKYRATHLSILTNKQLEQIDKILNKPPEMH